MVLEDDLAGIVQSGAHSCQLHQHIGAVVAFFHHPLYLFQVADGPGQPVHHGFLIFVDMAVGMGDAVGMEIGMIMFLFVIVVMIMFVGVVGNMVFHGTDLPFLKIWFIIPQKYPVCKPRGGIFPKK